MLCGVKPSRLHQTILIGIIHLPAVYIKDDELNTPSVGCLLLRYLHHVKGAACGLRWSGLMYLNSIATIFQFADRCLCLADIYSFQQIGNCVTGMVAVIMNALIMSGIESFVNIFFDLTQQDEKATFWNFIMFSIFLKSGNFENLILYPFISTGTTDEKWLFRQSAFTYWPIRSCTIMLLKIIGSRYASVSWSTSNKLSEWIWSSATND